MKIVTWNVNSIRVRMPRLEAWLKRNRPDVVCLQETKIRDDQFPHEELKALGYRAAIWGQPTYNGVAILTRLDAPEPTDVMRGFGDGDGNGNNDGGYAAQARFICATVGPLRIASAYIPNGSEVDSEKYAYKQRWLARLRAWVERELERSPALAILGDFNIAPAARDVSSPAQWQGGVLFNPEMTAAYDALLACGLSDAIRTHQPTSPAFTWWDYRNLSFAKNDGLRIDHILLSAPVAAHCSKAWVDRDERKGTKPSDHAPVWASLEI